MARTARIVIPDVPHHITQRGNNRQDIFFADADRRFFLRTLAEQAERFGLVVLGYCLMTNHIHIIGTPRESESLSKAIGRTHLRYTQYINRMHDRSGHLWQNRFYSCPLGNRHLFTAMRYVERNPVRSRMPPHRLALSMVQRSRTLCVVTASMRSICSTPLLGDAAGRRKHGGRSCENPGMSN